MNNLKELIKLERDENFIDDEEAASCSSVVLQYLDSLSEEEYIFATYGTKKMPKVL